MADMDGKVCPAHPDTPAVSRCVACFKPLCQACIIEKEGQHFCSEACAQNHFTTNQHVADMQERDRKRKRAALIKKLVILVVLLVLAAAGWMYYNSHKDELNQKIKDGQKRLKSATSEIQKKVNNRKN